MVRAVVLGKLPSILRSVSDEQGSNAAVSLLLTPCSGDFEFLLVKRAENASDPWSTQMALPGGKRDSTDASLKQTVIRETLEETAIELSRSHFLGVLDAVLSAPKPSIKILPFVVLLESKPGIRLNRKELVSFVWVAYEKIVDCRVVVAQGERKVPAYAFGDSLVWGITYRILEGFVQAVEKARFRELAIG